MISAVSNYKEATIKQELIPQPLLFGREGERISVRVISTGAKRKEKSHCEIKNEISHFVRNDNPDLEAVSKYFI